MRIPASIEAKLAGMRHEPSYFPCSTETESGELLGDLVRLIGARHVVELGTYKGATTLVLIAALWDAEESNIITIDVIDYRSKHLKDPELESRYRFHLGDSVTVLSNLDSTWDLAFVDTIHTFEQCAREVLSLLPRMRPEGLMVLHDALLFPGVNRVVAVLRQCGFSRLLLPTPRTPRRRGGSGVAIIQIDGDRSMATEILTERLSDQG